MRREFEYVVDYPDLLGKLMRYSRCKPLKLDDGGC